MRICLINPGRYHQHIPPLSLAYLVAYAKKYSKFNPIFKIIDENVGDNLEKEFINFKPDVVGVTSTTQLIKDAIRVAKFIKENSSIPVIIGGAHISSVPELTMQEKAFDIGVIGEGEQTFLELIDSNFENLKDIKGIIFRNNNGELIKTEQRPPIENMDSIPFPSRDLLKMEEYYLKPRGAVRGFVKRSTTILTSRGCPYNCIYCGSKLVWGRRFRPYSPEYVIKELKHLIDDYKVEALFFQDDTFIVDKERVKRICEMMIEEGINKKIIWECHLRANLVTENDLEFLRLLKRAGCVQVVYGFESCSERILKLLKNNSVTVEQNQKALDVSKQAGLRVLGGFMMGAPTETIEDIEKTKQFILKNKDKLDLFTMSITTPLPSTELWDICKKKGMIKEGDWGNLWMGQVYGGEIRCYSDIIPEKKLREIYNEFRFMSIEKNSFSIKFKNALRNPLAFRKIFFDYLYQSLKKNFRD